MFILSINKPSHDQEYFRNFHQLFENGHAGSRDVQILIESLRTRHFLKRKPLYEILTEVLKHMDTLREGGIVSDKTVQRDVYRLLVGTHMTAVFRNRQTGRVKVVQSQDSISKKRFPRKVYQPIYTLAQVYRFI